MTPECHGTTMGEPMRTFEYWWGSDEYSLSPEGDELLFKDKVVAIKNILETYKDEHKEYPQFLKITRYKKYSNVFNGKIILDDILEYADDNYKNEYYEDATVPSDRMKEAAEVFARVLNEEYVISAYDVVSEETIDVNKWMNSNDVQEKKDENT